MKSLKTLIPLSLIALAVTLTLISADINKDNTIAKELPLISTDNPIELGLVKWNRDFDKAIEISKKTGKPLFILFQEVPGCSNCQRFGVEVLSNPLIVDAIENEFVPLCVYNNKGGKDREVLKMFNEPTWNNPVVRIIDANSKELFPRMARFDKAEIVNGIRGALTYANKEVPNYFQLLVEQTNTVSIKPEKAVFSMYCFWSGELKLGQLEGVTNTVPGFMGGREVVEVTYNPEKTSYSDLVAAAKKANSFDGIFAMNNDQQKIAEQVVSQAPIKSQNDFRVDREPKYYMSRTTYRFIPMLPKQRILVNKAIYNRSNPQTYLSPSQIALLQAVNNGLTLPDFSLSDDIVSDWAKAIKSKAEKDL